MQEARGLLEVAVFVKDVERELEGDASEGAEPCESGNRGGIRLEVEEVDRKG